MLLLHIESRNSAQDITLVAKMPSPQWDAIKRNAIRYMRRTSVAPEGIEILERFPFELWRGTNGFGDEFEVLYLKADLETYLQLEKKSDSSNHLDTIGYRKIADAFEMIDHRLRFIAVEMDFGQDIAAVMPPILNVTSDVVDAALRDAQTLIGTSGAVSGLDRVHTAFHGYLESVCRSNAIPFKEDVSITTLFALLR